MECRRVKGIAIWVNLPFISQDRTREQLDGFGNLDATAEYARRVIHDVVEKYSGDPGAVFLTGFSRGGAACGFIGLRDPETADVWLGFHAVGGGDGAGWFGSEMSGALQRATRIKGRSSFVTDGGPWQDVLARLRQPFIFKDSQINAHVDSMFLDNRPSTLTVRKWMEDTLRDRPGVHDITGTVVDSAKVRPCPRHAIVGDRLYPLHAHRAGRHVHHPESRQRPSQTDCPRRRDALRSAKCHSGRQGPYRPRVKSALAFYLTTAMPAPRLPYAVEVDRR